MSKTKAMTLLELVIVIVIIGVLAIVTFAVTRHRMEYEYDKQAVAELRLFIQAIRFYNLETGNYQACVCREVGTGNNGCDLSSPGLGILGCNYVYKLSLEPGNWHYDVSTGGIYSGGFFVRAYRYVPPDNRLCQYSFNSLTDSEITGNENCTYEP